MAEIGLAASIVSVAAFGVSVAARLYETTDNVRNANQQIRDLAKHVTHFTTVLKHMGEVLETQKANCSKEVLRDIRKIKHSCKRTFKDIESTMDTKHFRRVMWLFKRSKAMELEARLDSQQSMLQCIIHTLTVSKLSHIDLRSKEDSGHITDLKVEIKLLKTFIKESYDNLIALRRAEQSVEGDRRPSTIDSPEPPKTWSPSPTPNASKSKDGDEDGEPSTNDWDDDVIHNDVTYTAPKDWNDRNIAGTKRDTSIAKALSSGVPHLSRPSYNDLLDPEIHRESNLLLQMVPYRPADPQPILSDRLISSGYGPDDSSTTSVPQEVAKSVRLLLDKWTISGSAPISNILEEEAEREKDEAELADKQIILDPQFETHKRSSSPVAEFKEGEVYPPHDPNPPNDPKMLEDSHRPQHDLERAKPVRTRDFSRPSYDSSHPPSRQLGGEILTELRSLRGGIDYIKSNNFTQVYYVDQYPIYRFNLVPWDMIPRGEEELLNTELGRGLIRREALDLFAYSYTETETGNFLISGNLELGQIEELVRLSYQAFERNLEERSKRIIKERGWGEAIDAMNRRMPRTRPNQPWAEPQHPFSRLHTPEPLEGGRMKQDAVKKKRSEVRFTSPEAQLVSDIAGLTKEVETSLAGADDSTNNVNAELRSVRPRHKRAKKKKDKAKKGKDVAAVFDLDSFVDLEAGLNKVPEQRREVQDKRFHRTEVETESESSDDKRAD